MIVVDSSAFLATLQHEPEGPEFTARLMAADQAVVSAVTLQEAAMVLHSRFGPGGVDDLEALIAALAIEVLPFTQEHARLAVQAFARFGKGVSPVGRLNLCDCSAYALAAALDAPLLCKGDDFPATDIRIA